MKVITKVLKKCRFQINKILKSRKKVVFTYTYYIPAPPKRVLGYREKEFDKLIEEIINLELEIINITCQAHKSSEGGGMWAVCLVRGLPKQIKLLNFLENDHNINDNNSSSPLNNKDNEQNDSLNGQKEIELPNDHEYPFDEQTIKGIYYFK